VLEDDESSLLSLAHRRWFRELASGAWGVTAFGPNWHL